VQVVGCIETFLDIIKDETLFRMLKAQNIRRIVAIIRTYANLLRAAETINARTAGFGTLALKLIRMGHMIISIIQTFRHLHRRLKHLSIK
jgi:hypothetical protein